MVALFKTFGYFNRILGGGHKISYDNQNKLSIFGESKELLAI